MSLHRDGASLTCDASDDNYFMIHVFEYLKLVSYCLVPFVIVIVLNLCIIVRLRQASPMQCMDAVSVSSSTTSTPRRSVFKRSRRYFFGEKSATSERFVQQNDVDEGNTAERTSLQDRPRSPGRREVMYVVWTCITYSKVAGTGFAQLCATFSNRKTINLASEIAAR